MWGLLKSMFTILGMGIHKAIEEKENLECKGKYRNINNLTYIDSKGKTRMISTDELVFYTQNRDNDFVLENIKGEVYHNFTKEKDEKKLKENIKKSRENGNSTYPTNEKEYYEEKLCSGQRFVDLETGEVFVIRYLQGKYYYMNILNGLLVRKTDWQLLNDSIKKREKEINIEEFNNEQKSRTDKRLLYRNSCYHSLCDLKQ